MTNHAKRRAKVVMAETGCGMRAAYNIMAKRTACSRAGHPANREPNGAKCTDCGMSLNKAAPFTRVAGDSPKGGV